MELKELIQWAVFGIIGYLLREKDADIKALKAECVKLKTLSEHNESEIKAIEQESRAALKAMQELTNLKLEMLTENINKMTSVMEKLEITIHHLDKNQANIGHAIEKYMQLEDRVLILEREKAK